VLADEHAVLAIPGAHFHDYGKAPRAGRKLGHVTITGDDADDVAGRARAVSALVSR
jgi:5-(carboxyamino)imidazole ribonucleotide synthase